MLYVIIVVAAAFGLGVAAILSATTGLRWPLVYAIALATYSLLLTILALLLT